MVNGTYALNLADSHSVGVVADRFTVDATEFIFIRRGLTAAY